MHSVGLLDPPGSSHASASRVLADMEMHLSDAGLKTQRWKNFGEAPWRQSAFGARSTPEYVHVGLLKREVAELEHFANRDMIPRLSEQIAELRREKSALRDASDRRVGELQSELAEVTHQCWSAKEELQVASRALSGKQDEVTRLSTSHSTEAGRCAALESQNAELRMERDDSAQALASEAARRNEVEAQLRECERELRLMRDKAEAQALLHAEQLRARDERMAEISRQAEEQLARSEEACRDLATQLSDSQLALSTEAAERAVAERAFEQREAALNVTIAEARAATEREASGRRELESVLTGVRQALQTASEAAKEAGSRAAAADEKREEMRVELERTSTKLSESVATRERLEDSLKASRDETAAAEGRCKALQMSLNDAERVRDEVVATDAGLRRALAEAESAYRNSESHSAAFRAAAAEQRASAEAEAAALRREIAEAKKESAEAEKLVGVVERSATQRIATSESRTARETRDFVIASRRREVAAKTEARRLRNALYEAESALQALWSETFARNGGEELLMLLPPDEAMAYGALAADGPSSWLSLAPPPGHHAPSATSSSTASASRRKQRASAGSGLGGGSPTTSGAAGAARRVAEAHRQRANAEACASSSSSSYVYPSSSFSTAVAGRGSLMTKRKHDDDDDAEENELVEEAVAAAAAAAAVAAAAADEAEVAGYYSSGDEEEEERVIAAAAATTRAVWDARLRVLSNAAFHSAASARRDAEVTLLSDEMLDVELRSKCNKVSRNSYHRRLRDLVRCVHTWRCAALMVGAAQAADEHEHANRWATLVLKDAAEVLDEAAACELLAPAALTNREAVFHQLATEAEALRLDAQTVRKEAQLLAAEEAMRLVAQAEEQQRAAEAQARLEAAKRAEAEAQLQRADREVHAELKRVEAEARAAMERLADHRELSAQAAERYSAELAKGAEERRGLEALVAEAADEKLRLAAVERALQQREATLDAQIGAEREKADQEASARREVESSLSSVSAELGEVNAAYAIATTAEAARGVLKAELDELREALKTATLNEEKAQEALRVANEAAAHAQEYVSEIDAEAESMRLTTNAIVGAREVAIARELQLDEGVEELSKALETAKADSLASALRATELSNYVGELEQMVLNESSARREEAFNATENEERLLARVAAAEATAERARDLEEEIVRIASEHEVALTAARDMTVAAQEAAKVDTLRAVEAEEEAARLRATAETARGAMEGAARAEQARIEAARAAAAEAELGEQREAALQARLKSLTAEAADADAARVAAERRANEALGEAKDARERLEEVGKERRGMIQREAAFEEEAGERNSRLRDAEKRASVAEAAKDAEAERVKRLREEVEGLVKSVGDARRQVSLAEETAAAARGREREMEQRIELSRVELEAEQAARAESETRLSEYKGHGEKLTSRLHAQLAREQQGKTAAERRAAERTIALQEELNEAQRETGVANRLIERLRFAAQGAAAAYCLRLLKGRGRERLRHAIHAWQFAAVDMDARDRCYATETRARAQLLEQAKHFQAKLEALEYEGMTH